MAKMPNDTPITADMIEQFLVGRHWWLKQPHTRLAYRIIRKLAAENAELRARITVGKWAKKVIDK